MITPPALELQSQAPRDPAPAERPSFELPLPGSSEGGAAVRAIEARRSGGVQPLAAEVVARYDDRRRRLYMTLCAAIGAPLLLAFALWNLSLGDPWSALADAAVGAVLALNLLWLRRRTLSARSEVRAARVTVGLLALLLTYNLVARAGESSQLLWLFVFPLVAFFVLGRRDGLLFTVLLWIAAVALVVAPELFGLASVPELGFRIRLPVILAVASTFAYGYERFREQAQELAFDEARRLETEHRRLVEAQERLERVYLEVHESYQILEDEVEQRKRAETEMQKLIDDLLAASAQVRRLRGLLPICSTCKRIRDDQGYWKQLEEYFHTHSEVVFSHGMCPGCLAQHYPEHSPQPER